MKLFLVNIVNIFTDGLLPPSPPSEAATWQSDTGYTKTGTPVFVYHDGRHCCHS